MSIHIHSEPAREVARRVTDMLDPKNWIIVTLIYLGWNSGGLSGIDWALFVTVFTAVLPALIINYGIRRGRWADRHVGIRRQRITAFAYIMIPVAVGAALMIALHAPRKMTAYIIGMLLGAIVLVAITVAWKISVHCTVSSAAVCIVALTYNPLVFLAYALVGLVAWSRVALGDHSVPQVVIGSGLGVIIATLTYYGVLIL